jgi:hypothetical protein
METMYFILGMLSIIGIVFVATIVWGIVKITRLLKIIKSHEEWQSYYDRDTNERFKDLHQDINRRFNDVYSYTDSRLDKLADKTLKQEKQIIKG